MHVPIPTIPGGRRLRRLLLWANLAVWLFIIAAILWWFR